MSIDPKKLTKRDLYTKIKADLVLLHAGNVTTDNHQEAKALTYLINELGAIIRDIDQGKPEGAARKFEAALRRAETMRADQWTPGVIKEEFFVGYEVQREMM